jgi:hypothetical protein
VIARRNPQQLGDDPDRQGIGELADDLNLPARPAGFPSASAPAAVSSSSDSSRIRGVSLAMTRGANALETRRRSRVWSGGSIERNDCGRRCSGSGASRDLFRSLLARGSRRMAEQSSCRPTTTSDPSASPLTASANGDASRSLARTGYGSGSTAGSARADSPSRVPLVA